VSVQQHVSAVQQGCSRTVCKPVTSGKGRSLSSEAQSTVQAAKYIQKAEKTRRLTYAELSAALSVLKPRLCLHGSFVMVKTQRTDPQL